MITCTPRPAAAWAKSTISIGVRWAESTRTSLAIPKRSRISTAGCMVARSESLPITTATRTAPAAASRVPPGGLQTMAHAHRRWTILPPTGFASMRWLSNLRLPLPEAGSSRRWRVGVDHGGTHRRGAPPAAGQRRRR